MSIKYKKASTAKENSLKANPHSTYTLGGRVYNSEKYAGPLNPRREVISHLSHNEKVSATDLHNIERMLEGRVGRVTSKMIDKQTKETIIQRYDLHQEENTHRWVGDPEIIYQKICEVYPHAVKYKKYSGLLYAMKYGDTPCVVYKGKDI